MGRIAGLGFVLAVAEPCEDIEHLHAAHSLERQRAAIQKSRIGIFQSAALIKLCENLTGINRLDDRIAAGFFGCIRPLDHGPQ